MTETRTVGGVQIELGGDAGKLLAELDKGEKAVLAFKSKAASAAGGAGQLAEANNENGKALNQMREKISRAQGAFGQLAGAMGETTGAAKYATQGFGTMASMLGAAGPLGIALAAATGLLALMNHKMEEAEAKSAALDARWQSLVDTAVSLRNAAADMNVEQRQDTTTNAAVAADPAHEASIRRQADLSRQLLDLTTQKLAVDKSIDQTIEAAKAKQTETIRALKGSERSHEHIAEIMKATREDIDNQTEALKGQAATLSVGIKQINEARSGVDGWAKSQKEAADAMERYAKAIDAAKEAVKELKQLHADQAFAQSALNLSSPGALSNPLTPNGMTIATPSTPYVAPINQMVTRVQALNGELQLATGVFKSLTDYIDYDYQNALYEDTFAWRQHASVGTNVAGNLAINLDDLGESSRQAKDRLNALTDAANAARGAFAKDATNAVLGGSAFQMLGGMAGSAVWTAAGTALGGPAGGLIGGGIGEALGSMLGGLVDKLQPVIDYVQIFMDALAGLIGVLEPILDPLRLMGKLIFQFVMGGIAPAIGSLAKALGGIVLIAVELVAVFEPLIEIVVRLALGLVLLSPVMDSLAIGLGYVARGLLMLVEVIDQLYNAIAGVVNTVVGWIRQIPGFEDWGQMMDTDRSVNQGYFHGGDGSGSFGDPTATLGATHTIQPGMQRWLDALHDNTDALHESQRVIGNVPDGFKVVLAEFQAQDARPGHRRHISAGNDDGSVTVFVGGERLTRVVSEAEAAAKNLRYGGMNDDDRWRSPGD